MEMLEFGFIGKFVDDAVAQVVMNNQSCGNGLHK